MEQQLSPFECAIGEVMAQFEEEKNAKNEAYLFIIESGNFQRFYDWKQQRGDGSTAADTHAEVVAALGNVAEQVITPQGEA